MTIFHSSMTRITIRKLYKMYYGEDLPRTTAYDNLAFLEKEGKIQSYTVPITNKERGRPYVLWEVVE